MKNMFKLWIVDICQTLISCYSSSYIVINYNIYEKNFNFNKVWCLYFLLSKNNIIKNKF